MIRILFAIIIYIISFFIDYLCLCKLTSKKIKLNIYKLLLIIAISLINYLSTSSKLIIHKSFVSITSSFIILRVIIHEDDESSLICSLFFIFLVSIIEIVCSLFIVGILKVVPIDYVTSTTYTKEIIGLLIVFIIYIVSSIKYIQRIYNTILKFTKKLKINSQYVLILFFMISIVSTFYIINVAGKLKIFYSLLYLSIFIIFIAYLCFSIHRNYYLKMINKYLLDKENEYISLLDEYRMYKHNIKSQFCLLKDIGNKKINKIIDEYNDEFQTHDGKMEYTSNLPTSFRSLIFNKMIKYDMSIVIDNYIENDPINILSLKTYIKLIESIGILLDNAFEESSSVNNGFVYMLLKEDHNTYIVNISNSLSNRNIDIDDMYTVGKSAKKNHEGIGISYIRKKTTFKLNNSIKDAIFYTELEVKK